MDTGSNQYDFYFLTWVYFILHSLNCLEMKSNLLEAVIKGDVDAVQKLLDGGERIDLTNVNGW